ncbi:MFS general substrate transporter [Cristinia sonorae]|uniref:MFS general substrate transporter n=1 Tax=Cristinia sonorae TaxID=1940300 RepID=A0A8K0UV25_9AGAR|nr:MFS general substrate transporter [Cristinia sonorae]
MAEVQSGTSEREPLLGSRENEQERTVRVRKPFYRARPLWIAPFFLVASMVRGMTLAPRVQVFTQLSCNIVHDQEYAETPSLWNFGLPLPAYSNTTRTPSLQAIPHTTHTPETPVTFSNPKENDTEDNPINCLHDPAVQAVAARLQTVMAMTVGTLCALSTGWWGHFGERHGRTRVLAAASIGLLLTDLAFVSVATPRTIFARHGQLVLTIAPIVEGLLGGWTTVQGASAAYISDCTSDGSRAHIFSRFMGVFFLGVALGPALGAYFIRNPIFPPSQGSPAANTVAGQTPYKGIPDVRSVFYVAIMATCLNLFLVLFVFPESLDKKKAKEKALAAHIAATNGVLSEHGDQDAGPVVPQATHLERLLSPLALFVPRKVALPGGGWRRDWSLAVVSTTLFMFLLSTGIFQIKYLYAEHIYDWGAEQLSYYISFMGAVRATNLLLITPFLISRFKPKRKPSPAPPPHPSASASLSNVLAKPKPKPTLPHLLADLSFDIKVVRVGLLIDFLSHFLVFLLPAGPLVFTVLTSMSSLGAGVHPAMNSVALGMVQMRGYVKEEDAAGGREGERVVDDGLGGAGRLFGALAVLQALGQYILGPMLFGLIYSLTVAHLPRIIFITAASMVCVALALTFLIRPERQFANTSVHVRVDVNTRVDAEEAGRGRSRAQKIITPTTSPRMSFAEGTVASPGNSPRLRV